MNAITSRTAPAASAARIHATDGSSSVRATSTMTKPGRTIRFGMSLCSRSVRVMTTRIQQKTAEMSAVAVSPKTRPQAPPSTPVAATTNGNSRERGAPASSGRRSGTASGSSSDGRRTGAFVATRSASGPTASPTRRPTTPAPTSTRPDSGPVASLLRAHFARTGHPSPIGETRDAAIDRVMRLCSSSPITRSRERGHSF